MNLTRIAMRIGMSGALVAFGGPFIRHMAWLG
ncbi:hypothetical protein V1290_006531 [Bradyrhizobium sp. AZCC 1578]